MRHMLFTAALLIGSAAFAQDARPDTEMKMEDAKPAKDMRSQPDTAQEGKTKPAKKPAATGAGEGITAEGTNPEGVAIAPPGTNVVATPEPGAGVVVAPDQSAMFATRPATEEYPRCSRTVTDNCVQGKPRR